MKTKGTTAVLCVVGIFVVSVTAEEWSVPTFCRSYDCPRYRLIREHETFEERLYYSSHWLTTDVEGFQKSAVIDGFMKLYYYTTGENEGGKPVNITVPGITQVSQTGSEKENVSVSLYVSPNTHIPKPSDGSIRGLDRPEAIIYVRVFGGMAPESDCQENTRQLRQDLTKAGLLYDTQSFFIAVYDHPLTLLGRHNEVWLQAK